MIHDICYFFTAIHPAAVVGNLVQKYERETIHKTIKKTHNAQNRNTNKQNKKTVIKEVE
jgi:hypothetical protein